MSASIAFVTPDEFRAVQREVADLRSMLAAYVAAQEEWLPTAQALKAAGVKTRETLVKYARATEPNRSEPERITFRKEGRKCLYSRSSCINYARRKMGLPTLAAAA